MHNCSVHSTRSIGKKVSPAAGTAAGALTQETVYVLPFIADTGQGCSGRPRLFVFNEFADFKQTEYRELLHSRHGTITSQRRPSQKLSTRYLTSSVSMARKRSGYGARTVICTSLPYARARRDRCNHHRAPDRAASGRYRCKFSAPERIFVQADDQLIEQSFGGGGLCLCHPRCGRFGFVEDHLRMDSAAMRFRNRVQGDYRERVGRSDLMGQIHRLV